MLLNVNTTVCDVREGEVEEILIELTQMSVLTQSLQEDDSLLSCYPDDCIDNLLLYNNLHIYHSPSNCSHRTPTCYLVNSGNPCERL